MTQIEFEEQVNDLAERAAAIKLGDYTEAISVVLAFGRFAAKNSQYIANQYVTEHLDTLKADFEEMKNARPSYNDEYFLRRKTFLENDIRRMHYRAPREE